VESGGNAEPGTGKTGSITNVRGDNFVDTYRKMENVDNDPKLSTLKRYIKALGGELSLDVRLPDGKRIALHL